MKPQLGYSSLVFTVVILVMALSMTLAGFRSVLSQQTAVTLLENQMKAQWRLFGAVACSEIGFQSGVIPARCQDGVDQLTLSGIRQVRVKAEIENFAYQREFMPVLAEQSGVFKTSGSLIFLQSSQFFPDVGEPFVDGSYPCIAIRYGKNLYATHLAIHPLSDYAVMPYFSINQGDSPRCHDDDTGAFAPSTPFTSREFVQDPSLEPFHDLFNLAAKNWMEVAEHPLTGIIPIGVVASVLQAPDVTPPEWNAHCASDIVQRIQQGHLLIWIYGSCELSHTEIETINREITQAGHSEGIIVLIHNGIVAIESDVALHGALVMLHYGESQNRAWQNSRVSERVNQIAQSGSYPGLTHHEQIDYFQQGRFYPSAGLFLATSGFAVMDGQLDVHFQPKTIAPVLAAFRPSHWLRASAYYDVE